MFSSFLVGALLVAVFGVGIGWRPAGKRQARRLASRLARLLLGWRARAYALSGNPISLIVAPHPDDDVLGCGGLIARKRAKGHPVHVVFITDGGASHRGHPSLASAELVALRTKEARAALGLLGVEGSTIRFLGVPDGELDRLAGPDANALAQSLTDLLRQIVPDEVFLPFRYDGSSEHEAAFRHFARALETSGQHPKIYEFPVWAWWNPLLLRQPLFAGRRVVRFRLGGLESLKARAIAVHRSQTESTPPWTEPMLSCEFVSFFNCGEEFFFEA